MNHRARCLAVLAMLAALTALPHDSWAEQDPQALLASGVDALRQGHADDAIASLETLADLGVADPVASYDRGLAYSLRVRVGGEVPGDLGRAVHGFEEARDLSHSRGLSDDASRALAIVRAEIVRRRLRAGESIETEPGRSLGRTVTELVDENTWALTAASASLVLSLGLFVHWLARARSVRIAADIATGVASPVLLVAVLTTLAARNDRWHLQEAIVVVPSAHLTDERGVARPGSVPLPEGARVELVEQRGAVARVRFGRVDAWVASSGLRELARVR